MDMMICDDTVREDLEDNVGASYIYAMTVCFEANRYDDGDDEDDEDDEGMEDCEALNEEGQCREVLYTVNENLESARTGELAPQWGETPKKILQPSIKFKVPKDIQSRSRSENLEQSTSTEFRGQPAGDHESWRVPLCLRFDSERILSEYFRYLTTYLQSKQTLLGRLAGGGR